MNAHPPISSLRDRIVAVIREHDCFVNSSGDVVGCVCGEKFGNDFSTTELLWDQHVVDTVIAILGRRRCERCHQPKWLNEFPDPHAGSDEMRPYCNPCTDYIEWATS